MTTAGLSAPGSTANAILQIATKPGRQSPQYAAWIEQQDFLEFRHAGGSDAKALREEMTAKHGDLKSHFRALADDCDRAIALMAELTDAGVL